MGKDLQVISQHKELFRKSPEANTLTLVFLLVNPELPWLSIPWEKGTQFDTWAMCLCLSQKSKHTLSTHNWEFLLSESWHPHPDTDRQFSPYFFIPFLYLSSFLHQTLSCSCSHHNSVPSACSFPGRDIYQSFSPSSQPLYAIKHQPTNLFFHQLTTHLDIHILFPHLYSPNSLYTVMGLPNVTVFSVYLFKPSIYFLPVNPCAKHPPASLWQKYLFSSPLQGNENLGCYLSIPQGRLYLVILKHSC